jgi:hypothetical protein
MVERDLNALSEARESSGRCHVGWWESAVGMKFGKRHIQNSMIMSRLLSFYNNL